MLEFLVTSKARRRLLLLLWGEQQAGTATALAEQAGVGFASAWRELQAMQDLGLAVSERQGSAAVFRANPEHPQAEILRALVARPRPAADREVEQVRAQLHTLGAPVQCDETVPVDDLEATVVRGVQLARKDPSVARALPVCLYRQRDRLNKERLCKLARQETGGTRYTLGFFLDLTALLSQACRSEPCFQGWTVPLHDLRRQAPREFFQTAPRSSQQRELAAARAPEVARRWGYVMNMELETFRSTFEKHVS